jgi:hypothetical protein
MNRILVIPDLRLRNHVAESLIERRKPTLTVFLGNYSDDLYGSPANHAETARWLNASMQRPDRVHLMGPHDVHYRWPQYDWASRVSSGFAHAAILRGFGEAGFSRMRLWHYDGESNTLFTYGGLSNPLVRQFGGWRNVLEHSDLAWLKAAAQSCDIAGFEPVPRLNQVFGHASGDEPVLIREGGQYNLCLASRQWQCAWIERGGSVIKLFHGYV